MFLLFTSNPFNNQFAVKLSENFQQISHKIFQEVINDLGNNSISVFLYHDPPMCFFYANSLARSIQRLDLFCEPRWKCHAFPVNIIKYSIQLQDCRSSVNFSVPICSRYIFLMSIGNDL